MTQYSSYRFEDPADGFAEALKRIGTARDTNAAALYLDNLGITTIPAEVALLPKLIVLDLSFNRLTKLPSSLFTLTSLQFINLHSNRLDSISEKIASLTALTDLWLSTNRLRSLPQGLLELSRLERLAVHNNPELNLPLELLGPAPGSDDFLNSTAKPADILAYYFRTRAAARPLNEAKLILLGRGEVGKTALVNRLVRDEFKPTALTRGIAITQWHASPAGARLNIWDFGGQEIQHATHQFFLTERSLYLVVLNGRAGAEDEDAEYWLKFIKTFGGSSPAIVVLNKFRVQPFEVNRRALREKYSFIRNFVETDCEPEVANGRAELIALIEEAVGSMEHVRAAFPADWFRIKERLSGMQERGESFISFEEYREICGELGEKDPVAQERLAGFLNALGVALNFREDPQLREETVLNPHWITEGVYQVLTSERLANRKGELRPGDMEAIFEGKAAYPSRMHAFLIELMRKFELCFPYHEDVRARRYLVPELLGKEKPELEEAFEADLCVNFRYDYRLMPEGLLPRFITRTHTMSEPSARWRTGVVLQWEGCRALVEADKQERQVVVRVTGAMDARRRLVAVIRENFDQIHLEMKEFKPTQWVALEEDSDRWVSYAKLETFALNRETSFREDVGDRLVSVDVAQLLSRTDVTGGRPKRKEHSALLRPLKLFVSYAHQDEAWRAKLAPNLALLQREGLIELWYDLKLVPGAKWDEEIQQRLVEADLYLFLMSTDLLASEYVQERELPVARRRHEAKQARLLPVVVRSCSWKRYVGDIHVLPGGDKAVKEWSDKDQAFFKIEMGLRSAIDELLAARGQHPSDRR
jgi:internalin A